jgi:hypothetical protein
VCANPLRGGSFDAGEARSKYVLSLPGDHWRQSLSPRSFSLVMPDLIRIHSAFVAAFRRDRHEQGRAGQMEIGVEAVRRKATR